MGKVEQFDNAVDHGVAKRDHTVKRAQDQSIGELL
jgi:hypothetical protein